MSPFDMTLDQSKELWSRIDAPLLLVSGSESWLNQGASDDPATYFRNARHVKFENAGHWVHHDRLADFLTLTRDFFAE